MNEKMEAVKAGVRPVGEGGLSITGEAVPAYALMLLIQSYAREITFGMQVTRVPLSRVAQQYGVTARSKKKALRELLMIWETTYGQPFEMSHNIERALAK